MSKTVRLGSRLRYPITVAKLLKSPGDTVKKQEPLMEYSFKWMKTVGDQIRGDTWEEEQTTIASWESPTDGDLKKWFIKEGDIIRQDGPCIMIKEECSHEIQFQGLCAVCGKDMTDFNWAADRRDTERAKISMVHDQTNLLVSETQAQRTEHELQRRLLESRKLSLVVDLDQTIIHACIDPTVGEWQRDPTNPNHDSVKDVKAFQLEDGPRGLARGCWYYIKMRPGLEGFLRRISAMYELHVYTMGTRAYAQNVARIVDPEQKLFGNRVISRDENGNMYAKSLQRLFPVSTNMVLIIDDRADVWPRNRTNLIKVSPYDFFKGIGDINSSFLPRRQDLLTSEAPAVANTNGKPADIQAAKEEAKKEAVLEELVQVAGAEDPTVTKLQVEEQERTLEKQIKDRPLQVLQEKLDKEDEEAEKSTTPSEDGEETPPQSTPHHRHQVLFDDDNELDFLEQHLTQIHKAYYEEYDRARASHNANGHVDVPSVPDVGSALNKLKSKALGGCKIVLSGLIPLGVEEARSEIGMQILSFGAELRSKISKDVTHLVVSSLRPRTKKVRQAAKIASIKIVNQDWLAECFSKWVKADETPYMFQIHPDDRPGAQDPAAVPTGEGETDLDEADETDENTAKPKKTMLRLTAPPKLRITSASGESHPLGDDDGDDSDDEDDGRDDDEVGLLPDDVEEGQLSPIDGLKTFDWGSFDDDLEAFMNEDTEDEDEDNGDETATGNEQEEEDTNDERDGDENHQLARKRKQADRDVEDDSESERHDENDGSNLSKRLRRIKSRGTSSLRNQYVSTAPSDDAAAAADSSLPTPQITGDEEDVSLLKGAGSSAGDQNAAIVDGLDDEFDDIDEAELEADFLAEFEESTEVGAEEKG